jgi:hypothetical protein
MANGALRGTPTDPQRPHQRGAAQGDAPGGGNANESKNWLIDSGAQISCISAANARHFRTTPTGATAGGVGGGALPIVRGITMVFNIHTDDPAYPGHERNVSCRLPVAITPRSDIIGMDQLASLGVCVNWDPKHGTGQLYEVTRPRRG